MSDFLLGLVSIWPFGVLLVLACIIASELGRLLERRLNSRSVPDDAQVYVIGAIFGLAAFLISMTFSMALDRYDERREWVVEEANAIRTAFLRASLLDEPNQSQLRSTLRDYAHSRIAPEGVFDENVMARMAASNALRRRLWEETRSALYPIRNSELASYLLEAQNRTFDIGTRRDLSAQGHIPARIFNVLLLYLLVASLVLGFVSGGGSARTRVASALLFVLFAIAILLIVDLDSPQAGTIKVPQTALTDLVADLDRIDLQIGQQPRSPPR